MTRNLTTEEVAGILRVSHWQVRYYAQTGRLGFLRNGGDHGPLTFRPSHVEAFLAANEHHPRPAARPRPASRSGSMPSNVTPIIRPPKGRKTKAS